MDAVTHFEIPVSSMKRAQDFYSSTFGWTVQDLPKFHYAMLGTRNTSETGSKQSRAIDGGMMLKSDLIKSIIITVEVSDIDQAIEIANDTSFGLASAVWAGDKDKAKAIAKKIKAGQCAINGGEANHEAPFGGYKESGNGREFGDAGLHEYCEIKALQY